MAFTPISNTVSQYEENGIAASGFYIKFYESGTTTPIAMAIDSTGVTTLDKCQLNTEGYPINGSSAVFIPHIDRKYKIVLFLNSADADANDLNSAVWVVDSLFPVLSQDLTINVTHDTLALAAADQGLAIGKSVVTLGHTVKGDGGGTTYVVVIGGTGTNDGILYTDMANTFQLERLPIGNQEFDLVSDAIAASWLGIGDTATTLGYLTIGDYGGGEYDVVAASTGTDDGGYFLDLNNLNQIELTEKDTIYFNQFGAVMDGVTLDDAPMNAALQSGAIHVKGVPGGNYKVSALSANNTALRSITVDGRCTFSTVSASSSRGLVVSPRQFFFIDNIKFISDGTKTDGNISVGLEVLPTSLLQTGHGLQCENYSGAGFRVEQCVIAKMGQYVATNCNYGLTFEKNGAVPATTVTLDGCYMIGCTRGLWSEGCVGLTLYSTVFEQCGDNVSNDAALHIDGGVCTVFDKYFEACDRNFIIDDAIVSFHGHGIVLDPVGQAPSIVQYTGLDFALRGVAEITNTGLNIRNIGPDLLSNQDLTIGENLVAPVAGGSVKFGDNETESLTGTVTSGVWSPIKIIEGQSGAMESRVMYRYAARGGFADLPTGFDTGTILNGVMRSDTGTLPSWLRLNVTQIEMNLVSSTYGLNFGLVLNKLIGAT